MSQLIALGVRTPEIDPAGSIMKGAQARQAMQGSQLESMKMQEEAGKLQALQGVRSDLQASGQDPYPDITQQVHKAIDDAKDEKEKRALEKRLLAIGDAVKAVGSFPEGSQERKLIGDGVIQDLVKAGHISPEMAQMAARTGYPDLFLAQYGPLSDAVKSHKARAEIAKLEAQTGEAKAKAEAARDPIKKRKTAAEIAKLEAETAAVKAKAGGKASDLTDSKIEILKNARLKALMVPFKDMPPDDDEKIAIEEKVKAYGDELKAKRGATRGVTSPQSAKGNKALFARNPNTGERMEWDYEAGKWVPVAE